MQRLSSREDELRQQSSKSSKSFSRYEPPSATPLARAQTEPVSTLSGTPSPTKTRSPEPILERSHSDIFETQDDEPAQNEDDEPNGQFPEGFAELPIEIQSLMERFLESLALKSRPAPLSIDRISELYQNFYVTVESHIATHIAALSSRIAREKSPTPSVSSLGSNTSRGPKRQASKNQDAADGGGPEQQMLTTSEITDRRKTRRQLELKKRALEEAVEQGVCEKVYHRIWRHRSTDDEERDEKLRSRAAALSVIGVDLRELLSTAMSEESGGNGTDVSEAAKGKEDSVRDRLKDARHCLEKMNNEKHPYGKLQHLTAAHKVIVETLSQMFPTSSSADEILPTLIYVIITSSPETNHVISNSNFVQRFRAAGRIDGEAAYCLTNLEAAISFLENVDLSSIRSNETPEGPAKPGDHSPNTKTDGSDPLYRGLPSDSPDLRKGSSSTSPATTHPHRSLSNLITTRPKAFESASGAVFTSADTAIDTLHGALDGSFRFFFGRLREKQATQSPVGGPEVAVPKTLEDARKLIDSPTVSPEEKDDISIEDGSSIDQKNTPTRDENSSKVLDLIGGRKRTNSSSARDRSVDSNRSTGSVGNAQGKKVALSNNSPATSSLSNVVTNVDGGQESQQSGKQNTAPPTSQIPGYGAVESMRTFGSSINPLKGFSMRGFGRNVSNDNVNTPSTSTPARAAHDAPTPPQSPGMENPSTVHDQQHPPSSQHSDKGAADAYMPAADLSGVGPPIQRFVELKESRELTGFDVDLLLRDYQRLAGVLRALGQRKDA
ncbi:MAG: hypothetical protein M1831_007342 [Alyxoria varia]|nr:MAG: hypothetical protein M1831_007342 [Alyxoria varia]